MSPAFATAKVVEHFKIGTVFCDWQLEWRVDVFTDSESETYLNLTEVTWVILMKGTDNEVAGVSCGQESFYTGDYVLWDFWQKMLGIAMVLWLFKSIDKKINCDLSLRRLVMINF